MNEILKKLILITNLTTILFIIIFNFLGYNVEIGRGPCMLPTLPNFSISITRDVKDKTELQRKDIISFNANFPQEFESGGMTKRLVAIENDTVYAKNGILYVNNKIEREDVYLEDFEKITIPEDHFFVLGDNSRESTDSRFYNTLHFNSVVSKHIIILNKTQSALFFAFLAFVILSSLLIFTSYISKKSVRTKKIVLTITFIFLLATINYAFADSLGYSNFRKISNLETTDFKTVLDNAKTKSEVINYLESKNKEYKVIEVISVREKMKEGYTQETDLFLFKLEKIDKTDYKLIIDFAKN